MFNFVSLWKYKRQMTGNKLCKPAQRSVTRHLTFILQETEKIKHSILIITEVITKIIPIVIWTQLIVLNGVSNGYHVTSA